MGGGSAPTYFMHGIYVGVIGRKETESKELPRIESYLLGARARSFVGSLWGAWIAVLDSVDTVADTSHSHSRHHN